MTGDRDAFLAAVRAAPDDDLPRLVYADWLEERGDGERAEFIRLSCETPPEPRADAVEARLRELLAAHGRRWRIPGLRGRQHFARGFVADIEVAAESLLSVDPRAMSEHPVRSVRLVAADRRVEELARLPLWATVESLTLNNNNYGTGRRLETLLGAGGFPRLRSLSLRNNRLWPEAVQALAALPVTTQLTRLDLSGNPIADAGAAILAEGAAFENLAELLLRSDELDDDFCIHAAGAGSIALGRWLSDLRALNLAGHGVGNVGLFWLAARPPFGRALRHLDLSYNGIDGEIVALTGATHLGELRRVSLAGSRITDADLAALRDWPRLPQLERLDLRDCGDVGELARLPNVLSGAR